MMDGLIAIWLVVRFNLFCSLRSSFRQLPELRRAPIGKQQTASSRGPDSHNKLGQ
jgi:hypothetical protein